MPSQFHLAGTVTGTSCHSLSALGLLKSALACDQPRRHKSNSGITRSVLP